MHARSRTTRHMRTASSRAPTRESPRCGRHATSPRGRTTPGTSAHGAPARRPADAGRGWGDARSRSRAAGRRCPTQPRPRPAPGRTLGRRPPRRARGAAGPRWSSIRSAAPRPHPGRARGRRSWRATIADGACQRAGPGTTAENDGTLKTMSTATREGTVEAFLIEGGVPLSGTVRPAGNKNAALPILAAALLTGDPLTLENVPRIRDVEELLELMSRIGVEVEWLAPNTVRVWAADVTGTRLDPELCERIRASILLAGPLLARFRSADVPPPGGDVIGRRRVDTHLMAFEALGATVEVGREYLLRARDGLRGADIHLDEASVTGTENAVMAAALARGTTRIANAACEPHVQDLCRLLERMGARIDGIGSNVLTVHGAQELRGCTHRIGSDH